jgi:hydroxymethylpyrimidine pyrophosphatase-like HAD family hydrolase
MRTFKGIIALDIDGTITVARHSLEVGINNYLNQLIAEGWQIIFITGRTFAFARPVLSCLEGDYFLAVQNGAALYQMPQERCVKKKYLSSDLLAKLDPLFQNEGRGMLVESGKENGDICYYKPNDFSPEELEYIAFRTEISCEKWIKAESFAELPIEEFAVGKYFAVEKQALKLAEKILKIPDLSVTVIRDPFRPGFHLALINAIDASKGEVLEDLIALSPASLPVIAAGDDYNDVEMLEKGTVKIVMQNGPAELHQLADILAPPAEQQGIIQGLKEAIALII